MTKVNPITGRRPYYNQVKPRLDEVFAGNTSSLQAAFMWSLSPQGHDHWQRRYSGEVPLSQEDLDWLKSIYDEAIE